MCSASMKVSLSSCADSVSLSSSGTDGSSLRLLVLKVGAISSPFLHRDFLAGLKVATEQTGSSRGNPFLKLQPPSGATK